MTLYLGVFGLMACISPSIGNIFLWLAILTGIYNWRLAIVSNKKFSAEYCGFYLSFGIFIISIFLSALFSDNIYTSMETLAGGYIRRMLPFFLVILFINDLAKLRFIILAIVGSIFLADICAVWQGLNGNFRANGFFGNPMTLGGFLIMLTPCIMIFLLKKQKICTNKKVIALILFASLLALFFNGTRGSWVAIAIMIPGLLCFILNSWKKIVALICLIGLIGIGTFAFVPAFHAKVITITDLNYQSNSERFLLWRSSYNMFKDHPLFGIGVGQFSKQYSEHYILPQAKEPSLPHAHNNFIHMLGETGIVGIIGFLVLIGYFLWFGIYHWYKKNNIVGLMLVASLVGLLLQGMTEFNFGNAAVMKLFWLLAGCFVQYVLIDNKEKSSELQ